MQDALFIGAGEIGTALANVVKGRANVVMWDKNPELVSGMKSLEENVLGSSVIFICVPSWAVRDLLIRIAPFLRHEAIVVSLAKGIEEKTLKTMEVVLEESLPSNQKFGILGGPLLAEEIMDGLPGIGVFASKSHQAFVEISAIFDHSNIRLEYNDDPHTVALVAVLKNVYAVGLGIAEGLGWGWNGKGWLAAQAMREMRDLVEILDGERSRVDGSSGAGDFLATAMSPNSSNRGAGLEIAQSGTCKVPSEGCRSMPSLLSLLHENISQFPLLFSINRVIIKDENSKNVFQDLFTAR
ncbi:MAG: hypothetical protein AAB337_00695 [Patescibacteria group bacterium]